MGWNKQLEENFSENLIPYVFDELQTRFSFNVKMWKNHFQTELENAKRGKAEVEVFFEWGISHINPILNKILFRPEHQATWYSLLTYVLKKYGITDDYKNRIKNYYSKSNNWGAKK
jgi:hypothetical protein